MHNQQFMNDPQPGPPPSASAEGQFLQHMSGSEIRAYRAWLDLPWSRLAPEQHTTLAALSKRFPGFIELQNGGTHTGEPFTPRLAHESTTHGSPSFLTPQQSKQPVLVPPALPPIRDRDPFTLPDTPGQLAPEDYSKWREDTMAAGSMPPSTASSVRSTPRVAPRPLAVAVASGPATAGVAARDLSSRTTAAQDLFVAYPASIAMAPFSEHHARRDPGGVDDDDDGDDEGGGDDGDGERVCALKEDIGRIRADWKATMQRAVVLEEEERACCLELKMLLLGRGRARGQAVKSVETGPESLI